jgi:chromosome transmission fidelity protein 8
MPTTTIHPPPSSSGPQHASGLPPLLQTPSGLAILEIQGTLNAPGAKGTSGAGPYPIGKLVFPGYNPALPPEDTSWQKRVYLYVGKHQRMTGEVKRLAKPLAVLRRREDAQGIDGESELEIAEVVRWKLVFAHRPEPVGGESG